VKQKNTHDIVIALAVILVSAILLGTLAVTLGGVRMGATQTITIDMPSVTGLRIHSGVRYAGLPVGRVLRMEALPWDQRRSPELAVRVTAELFQPVPELKSDSLATVSADTILAEKFLNILPGTSSAPALAAGEPVPAAAGGQIEDLLSSGGELMATANALLRDLRSDYPGLRNAVAEALGGLQQVTVEASALIGQADGVLDEASALLARGGDVTDQLAALAPRAEALAGQTSAVLENFSRAGTRADEVLTRLDALVARQGPTIDQTLVELRVSLQNLKIASTYLKFMTERLGREPWRLVWGTRNPTELPAPEEILQRSSPFPLPTERPGGR
jgi:phospholipid/cholesterol/gamma-HCH transport system substrate-binding protein